MQTQPTYYYAKVIMKVYVLDYNYYKQYFGKLVFYLNYFIIQTYFKKIKQFLFQFPYHNYNQNNPYSFPISLRLVLRLFPLKCTY